jgi:hypothetical protein
LKEEGGEELFPAMIVRKDGTAHLTNPNPAATVTILVTPENTNAPTASAPNISLDENATQGVPLTIRDHDFWKNHIQLPTTGLTPEQIEAMNLREGVIATVLGTRNAKPTAYGTLLTALGIAAADGNGWVSTQAIRDAIGVFTGAVTSTTTGRASFSQTNPDATSTGEETPLAPATAVAAGDTLTAGTVTTQLFYHHGTAAGLGVDVEIPFTDTILVQITDKGGKHINVIRVPVIITPINDNAPVALSDTITVYIGKTLTIDPVTAGVPTPLFTIGGVRVPQ